MAVLHVPRAPQITKRIGCRSSLRRCAGSRCRHVVAFGTRSSLTQSSSCWKRVYTCKHAQRKRYPPNYAMYSVMVMPGGIGPKSLDNAVFGCVSQAARSSRQVCDSREQRLAYGPWQAHALQGAPGAIRRVC
eukprot:237681-Prymnesium_polylepis.2